MGTQTPSRTCERAETRSSATTTHGALNPSRFLLTTLSPSHTSGRQSDSHLARHFSPRTESAIVTEHGKNSETSKGSTAAGS